MKDSRLRILDHKGTITIDPDGNITDFNNKTTYLLLIDKTNFLNDPKQAIQGGINYATSFPGTH